jgi:DNA-binding response OmpR family regulator
MTRVLVVEDEPRLARSLRVGLTDESYLVDVAADGEEALWFASSGHHDVVVLDLRLPRLGGLEVCRRLRAKGSAVPILMLTACDATGDIVAGLDAGGDDYMTKPFELAELLARLRALLRRGSRGSSALLRVAGLEVDTAARTAKHDGSALALTNMEYRLLEFLMLRAGSVQSRARIAAALWSDETGPDSNVIEVLVSGLRRKLQGGSARDLLQTRRGVGYVLAEAEA